MTIFSICEAQFSLLSFAITLAELQACFHTLPWLSWFVCDKDMLNDNLKYHPPLTKMNTTHLWQRWIPPTSDKDEYHPPLTKMNTTHLWQRWAPLTPDKDEYHPPLTKMNAHWYPPFSKDSKIVDSFPPSVIRYVSLLPKFSVKFEVGNKFCTNLLTCSTTFS